MQPRHSKTGAGILNRTFQGIPTVSANMPPSGLMERESGHAI